MPYYLKKIIDELEQTRDFTLSYKNKACYSLPLAESPSPHASTFYKMGDFFAAHQLTLNYYEIICQHIEKKISQCRNNSVDDPELDLLKQCMQHANQSIAALHDVHAKLATSRAFLPVFVREPSLDPNPLIPQHLYKNSLNLENLFYPHTLAPRQIQSIQNAIFSAISPDQCLSNLAILFDMPQRKIMIYGYNARYKGYILHADSSNAELQQQILKISKFHPPQALRRDSQENLWIIDAAGSDQLIEDLSLLFDVFLDYNTLTLTSTFQRLKYMKDAEFLPLLNSHAHICLFGKFDQPVSIKTKTIKKLLKQHTQEQITEISIIERFDTQPLRKSIKTFSKRLLIYFKTINQNGYMTYLDTDSLEVLAQVDQYGATSELLKSLHFNTLDLLKIQQQVISEDEAGA